MKYLEKILKIAYEAKINTIVWGTHGIGKTAVIESLEKDGYYVKVIILSQSDPLVLGGYPGREQIAGEVVTTFAKPQWIIDCEKAAEDGKKVIVFLDEFNRADRYALAAALRLVNEGEISGHKVPEGTLFVGACNPETEEDSDVEILNAPTIDRWAHVPAYVDTKAWLSWADKNSNPLLTKFIRTNNEFLNGFSIEGLFEEQVANRIKPTPRSNAAVGRILSVIEKSDDFLKELNSVPVSRLIRGLCGNEYYSALLTFAADNFYKPFEVEEVLSGDKKVLKRVKELVDAGQVQVLIASLETAYQQIPEKYADADLSGLWKFLLAVPSDVCVGFWYIKGEQFGFWQDKLVNDDIPTEIYNILASEDEDS